MFFFSFTRVFTTLLIVFVNSSFALSSELRFVKKEPRFIKLPDLNESVSKIIQAKNGFLWLGTQNGLIRYDGHEFRRYQSDGMASSLSHNSIMDIVEDHHGKLWISTYGGGLNSFIPSQNRFESFHHVKTDNTSMSSDVLWDISLSDDNTVWVGSRNWLNGFNTESNSNVRYHKSSNIQLNTGNNIWAILQYSSSEMWLSVLSEGLYFYNVKTGVTENYRHIPNKSNSLSNNLVRAIVRTEDKLLWLGTDHGLNSFNPETKQFVNYFHDPARKDSLSSNEINSIYEDSRGYLWVGTYGGGLNYINRSTQKVNRFTFPYLPNEEVPKIIYDITEDKQGNIWIATEKGGFKLPANALSFERWQVIQDETILRITAQYITSANEVWLSTQNSLINVDFNSGSIKKIIPDIKNSVGISENDDGILWVTTLKEGLYKLSPEGVVLNHFTHAAHPEKLPSDNIRSIFIDKEQNIWLGFENSTLPGGLILFSEHDTSSNLLLSGENIFKIIPLNSSQLLLGTTPQGLHILDKNSFTVSRISSLNKKGDYVNDVISGKINEYWSASDVGGITLLKGVEPQESWLNHKMVDALVFGRDNKLWMTSQNELISFSPESKKSNTFDNSDGLDAVEFQPGQLSHLNENKLIFTSINSVFLANIISLNQLISSEKVGLTELRVLNKRASKQRFSVVRTLNQKRSLSNKLTLTADEYLFSIKFSSFDFSDSQRVSYQYKLEGLDPNWINTDVGKNMATYTALSAGRYLFKARVKGKPLSEFQLEIEVLPAWWESTSAYLAYTIFTLLLIWLFVHLRFSRMKRYAKELEVGIEGRVKELNNKNQTINHLLEQKKRLFANVSHEFRTPLTLILSPLTQMIDAEPVIEKRKKLKLIKVQGERLLNLVDQLLSLARTDSKVKKIDRIDVVLALENITNSFEPLAKDKGISIISNATLINQDTFIELERGAFETILSNLLSNAIKYSKSNSKVIININITGKCLNIIVADCAPPITESLKDLLFERFERGRYDSNEKIPGAGLGLSIVRDLVVSHGGNIGIEKHKEGGNSFVIRIPQKVNKTLHCDNLTASCANVTLPFNSLEPYPLAGGKIPKEERAIKQTVLIVEDCDDLRAYIEELLTPEYKCLTATNGEEGLYTAMSKIPDIVITDIMMPEKNGYELARKIRANQLTCHIPIIFLTAKVGVQFRIQGWLENIDDYIEKPFNAEEFLVRVRGVLSVRNILSEKICEEIEKGEDAKLNKLEMSSSDKGFLSKIEGLVNANIFDKSYNVENLATSLHLETRQLQRKLKAISSLDFTQYLRLVRLTRAKALLVEGKQVSWVSDVVGFSSNTYFSTCFKEQFGITPKKYQQKMQTKIRDLNKVKNHNSTVL